MIQSVRCPAGRRGTPADWSTLLVMRIQASFGIALATILAAFPLPARLIAQAPPPIEYYRLVRGFLPEVFTEPMHFMTLINNTSDEELFEARRIIESGLAELAAERASDEDIKALNIEIEGMRATTNDPENYLKHDVRFHQAMAHAANNKLMSGVMDTVAQLLFHLRRQTISHANDLEEAIDWHQKIIDAMKKHDPKRAKEMLSGHLRASQAAWARENRENGSDGKAETSSSAKRRGK